MTEHREKQSLTREERKRQVRAAIFRGRWISTLTDVFLLSVLGFTLAGKRAELLAILSTRNIARFIHSFDLTLYVSAFLATLLSLCWTWYQVAKYSRDEEKQAQEALLADASRQTEGVWPPAPRNPT